MGITLRERQGGDRLARRLLVVRVMVLLHCLLGYAGVSIKTLLDLCAHLALAVIRTLLHLTCIRTLFNIICEARGVQGLDFFVLLSLCTAVIHARVLVFEDGERETVRRSEMHVCAHRFTVILLMLNFRCAWCRATGVEHREHHGESICIFTARFVAGFSKFTPHCNSQLQNEYGFEWITRLIRVNSAVQTRVQSRYCSGY